MAATLLSLRYDGRCASCGRPLPKGTRAAYDRARRTVTCVDCLDAPTAEQLIDRGDAGASAAREYQRRRDRRETRVRQRFGALGGVVLALTEEPQSTTAWARGQRGESVLGGSLDTLRPEGIATIHDRRIPGSKANLDHVAIASTGVFVIDAKRYQGRVERRDMGGLFRSDNRLYVRGRDQTRLVAGMAKQVAAVRQALGPDLAGVPVTPVLCFVDADWPALGGALTFGDVHVLWPRKLRALLRADGPLSREQIAALERRVAAALPPA